MNFSSLSVSTRIGIAVGMPIIALLTFAFLYIQQYRAEAERMSQVAELTEFGRQLSGVIHELQRERGNSAGFIGSGGEGVFRQRLANQRQRTDLVVEQYFEAANTRDMSRYSEAYAEQIGQVNADLRELSAHRAQVDTLTLSLGQTVSPYTATINDILKAFVEEVHEADDSGLVEGMIALLNLMEAKENAGIERAVGANSLGSGTVNRNNHTRLTELQAAQEAFLSEFILMTGPEWESRLDTAIAPTVEAVQAYRDIMQEGGYGGAVPQGEGGQWFDASTQRIDALMDVETQYASYLVDLASTRYAQASQAAWIVGAVALVVTGLIIAFFCSDRDRRCPAHHPDYRHVAANFLR